MLYSCSTSHFSDSILVSVFSSKLILFNSISVKSLKVNENLNDDENNN